MKNILLLILLVFSISTNAQSQSIKVTLRNGTTIHGTLKELDVLDHVTIIVAGKESRIPMNEVAFLDDGEKTTTENVAEKEYYELKDLLADYKGFLLDKGNNVYVYCDGTECEIAGANELKRLLKQDGFWNVVDYMIEAHFTINYSVSFKKRDHISLSVSSWRVDKKRGYVLAVETGNGLEDQRIHIEEAKNLYYDYVVGFQNKIVNKKLPQSIVRQFTID